MTKNKHAAALGRLKRGVKEIPSRLKRKSARENLILARKTRWLKNNSK